MLSLNEFAEYFQLNPYSFNQLTTDSSVLSGYDSTCDVWFEKDWYKSDDRLLTREDIKLSINRATIMISNKYHYFPKINFIVDEEHQYPEHYAQENTYGYGSFNKRKKTLSQVWVNYSKTFRR